MRPLNSKTDFFFIKKKTMTCKRCALLLASLVLVVSEDFENKIKNPRKVSAFERTFLKKGKNEVNGKIFFVTLMRIIVNIITITFI